MTYELHDGNGIVKEYCNDTFKLIFEGEYKNWKRNGNGKEFQDKILKFEGKYLNGKRNGKGVEYNSSGNKIIFESEYLNDKKMEKAKNIIQRVI